MCVTRGRVLMDFAKCVGLSIANVSRVRATTTARARFASGPYALEPCALSKKSRFAKMITRIPSTAAQKNAWDAFTDGLRHLVSADGRTQMTVIRRRWMPAIPRRVRQCISQWEPMGPVRPLIGAGPHILTPTVVVSQRRYTATMMMRALQSAIPTEAVSLILTGTAIARRMMIVT